MKLQEAKSIVSKMSIEKTIYSLNVLKSIMSNKDLIKKQWYCTARINFMIDDESILHIDDESTF